MRVEDLIREAEKKIDAMDQIDKKNGRRTPHDIGLLEVCATAALAIKAAMAFHCNGDENSALQCAAEAYVMLNQEVEEARSLAPNV
jgi:hypothetical protein